MLQTTFCICLSFKDQDTTQNMILLLFGHLPACASCCLRNKSEPSALYILYLEIETPQTKLKFADQVWSKTSKAPTCTRLQHHGKCVAFPAVLWQLDDLPLLIVAPLHAPSANALLPLSRAKDPRRLRLHQMIQDPQNESPGAKSDMAHIFKNEISFFSFLKLKGEFAPPDPGRLAPRGFVSRNKVTWW